MQQKRLPFNISILEPTKQKVGHLAEITASDIWDTSSGEYHPAGLYSTLIFGLAGEQKRNQQHALIKLNTTVFHPKLLMEIFRLKGLYKDILEGKGYAIFDKKLKDFVRSDALDGDTGFHFFVKHFNDIKFARNESKRRDLNIDLIEKYRKVALMDKLVVLPAGLRDIEMTEGGRPIEHELSKLYRSVLTSAATISPVMQNKETADLDLTRWKVQRAVLEVYAYLENMISGKSGFIQGKWAARRVFGSTRNVISAMDMTAEDMDSPRLADINTTQVGIHQFIKGCSPLIQHKLNTTLLVDIVSNPDGEVPLIDPKTLKLVPVKLKQKTRDKWTTIDGLNDTMNGFDLLERRHKPVMVDGHFLALIYKDEKSFRIFKNMEELPPHLEKENVYPLTWAELFYYAAHSVSDRVYGFVTRYPVTGLGSIYPTKLYCKSTNPAISLTELADDWTSSGSVFPEMPDADKGSQSFVDTTIPHSAMLKPLGADFDGDTVSLTLVYSDESVKEMRKILNGKEMYLQASGGLMYDTTTDVSSWVLKNFK